MTTKEQERKALEQIRKIVEGLGNDSYVGTAFQGCFEVAANNIENDWACSMKDRAETAERECKTIRDAYTKDMKDMKARNDYLKAQVDKAAVVVEEARSEAHEAWDKYRDMEKLANNHAKEKTEEIEHVGKLEDIIKQKDEEIMMLKAKLYDMMTK